MSEFVKELKFCLSLWEKQGYCEFGGKTFCEKCAAPYLLWKLQTGEVMHGKMKRLNLKDWKGKIKQLKD